MNTDNKQTGDSLGVSNYLAIISLLSLACYIFGFLIWNLFLYNLRFNEIGILQTRFIYTGFFFIFYISLFFLICYLVIRSVGKYFFVFSFNRVNFKNFFLSNFIGKTMICLVGAFLSFCVIFFYTIFLFPQIPRSLGGGRPMVVSLLTNQDGNNLSMGHLKQFGVEAPSDSEYQTGYLCIAYENNDTILLLLKDRTLQIDRSKLNGVAFLPIVELQNLEKKSCVPGVGYWFLMSLGGENTRFTSKIFAIFYNFPISWEVKK